MLCHWNLFLIILFILLLFYYDKLNKDYAEQIAKMLVDYFGGQNEKIGKNVYSNSYEIMLKHISSRLVDDNNPIIYKGIIEKEKLLGFINYFENKDSNTLEIWTLVGKDLSKNQKEELLNECYQKYKSGGYKKITAEFADNEKDLIEIFSDLGGVKLSNNYMINDK